VNEPQSDLTDWLVEAGHRTVKHDPQAPDLEASAEILSELDELAGRKVRSRAELRAYLKEFAAQARKHRTQVQLVREGVLVIVLLLVYLQYYFVDVQLHILSLPSLVVFLSSS
jgi:hypothetical protein